MRRIVLPALFLLMALAGCGGDSKETTTQITTSAPQPQTKAEYVQVADAICRNHQSRREDLESQAGELGPLAMRGIGRFRQLWAEPMDTREYGGWLNSPSLFPEWDERAT